MKATLVFDLPQEREEYEQANKASAAFIVLHEFYQQSLRKRLKYLELSKAVRDEVEKIQKEFFELTTEYGIDI